MIDPGAPPLWQRAWPPALVGLVGVASLPLVILPTLEALMGAGRSPTHSLALLAVLSLIQPTLLVIVAAFIGAALAPALRFTSYLAGVNVRGPFVAQLRRALAAGLVVGVVIVALDIALFRHFTLHPIGSVSLRGVVQALVGGLLYGGLSEEVMMRWGLMTLVVWLGARLAGRRTASAGSEPGIDASSVAIPAQLYAIAIVLVAVVFAAGHLPAASAMAPLTADVVLRILLLNGVAGLVFGWLYWKASLESAMLAHATVHVVFAIAQYLGWG
ncbi:MAG TPA: CPBP family glutamic-type intramembrane protease [Casimicrobiaceae bacterium]|nr:CPBP family glutamic-type intramembrane protease [Casimicrobiaceae bacterium]